MFIDEDVLAGTKGSTFRAGISNEDSASPLIEKGIGLSTPTDRANWVYYDITLGCMLDSGIVVHRRLPQVNSVADTLASCAITDANIDTLTGRGVNLISNDTFQDVVQRMAHSRYWFRLWGQAMRIREQVPIPSLRKIAGVEAIPHDNNPQWAYNKQVGNYSGQILWYAEWSLWYTLATEPTQQQITPPNLAQHISEDADQNNLMQAPISLPDDNAQISGPPRQRVI